MKTKKVVFLWSLLPIASAALFYALLSIDVEAGIFIAPIFKFSIVGTLALLAGIFATGFAGFRFSKNGVDPFVAILAGNALPTLCVVVYTVFVVIGKGGSDVATVIGEFGNGIFSVLSLYLTVLAARTFSYLEVYISFALLIITFVVGYSVGRINAKK